MRIRDTLIVIALVLFILVCVVWLTGPHTIHLGR